MKILMANVSLERLAGSETWTMTMYDYLSRRHDVDVYVPNGERNTLIKSGYDKSKKYDIALINHNVCLWELRDWNITRRIFTSHGVIPHLEQPEPGADRYVSVSEEVQDNLIRKGFESEIIRNPIDTDRFSYAKPNDTLRNILWMNNRAPNTAMIEEVSEGYDYRVQTGWSGGTVEAIQWADLVITSGRGVYEALSCGKNAMVVNWCGCDGFVTENNIESLRTVNCSGRFFNTHLPPPELRDVMAMYDPERNMRSYILENNNVEVAAERYLSL